MLGYDWNLIDVITTYSSNGEYTRPPSGLYGTWQFPTKEHSLGSLDDIPFISPSQFEKDLTRWIVPVLQWSRKWYCVGPIVSIIYLIFVWLGPKVMANRKAFNLRIPLMLWNLFLALFSMMGMVRVLPHVLYLTSQNGFRTWVCTPSAYTVIHNVAGFWSILFVYSKFAELLDTVFIVLRKKPLGFLHWYHHLTVLMYSWDGFLREQPLGVFFCSMNYSVHTVMYFYYFLSAFNKKPPRWGIFVTVLQIIQMMIGILVTMASMWMLLYQPFHLRWTIQDVYKNHTCNVVSTHLFLGCIMYVTYFYLFLDFFARRHFVNGISLKKEHAKITSGGVTEDLPMKNLAGEKVLSGTRTRFQAKKYFAT